MNKIIISLLLFVTLAAAIITTPLLLPAYAQSRACPEGFELNRGVCQAEPTIIPGECPDSLGTVVTTPEEVEEGMCRTANTGAYTNPLFINACNEVGGVIVQTSQTAGHCLFPIPDGEIICERGVLNEQSEMCEIRPGNNRR